MLLSRDGAQLAMPNDDDALLPIVPRPTPFTLRFLLALKLAGLRAAEITFALKVIDERWEVTPYEFIAGAGHARGRILAFGLGASWRPR